MVKHLKLDISDEEYVELLKLKRAIAKKHKKQNITWPEFIKALTEEMSPEAFSVNKINEMIAVVELQFRDNETKYEILEMDRIFLTSIIINDISKAEEYYKKMGEKLELLKQELKERKEAETDELD